MGLKNSQCLGEMCPKTVVGSGWNGRKKGLGKGWMGTLVNCYAYEGLEIGGHTGRGRAVPNGDGEILSQLGRSGYLAFRVSNLGRVCAFGNCETGKGWLGLKVMSSGGIYLP